MSRARTVLQAIRDIYGVESGPVPLHAPVFGGREGAYVQETIQSTFVSYVGAFVDRFERMLEEVTGAAHAVAVVNGTAALHIALLLADVRPGDLVVTQSLSFAATSNAIAHAAATPAFVDVDRDTLGLSPEALREFLESSCERGEDGRPRHVATGARVAACVPMHSFGHPCRIAEIAAICEAWGIPVVEDAAEALGSRVGNRSCGTFGLLGTLSFNGNKIVTCGGGGAILTNDPDLARRAKHLTTTAKVPHRWRFVHDEVGYNLRLPNLNAALGCAQLERFDAFVDFKRDLAARYRDRMAALGIPFVGEPAGTRSIYWLCCILSESEAEREDWLAVTNDDGVMTRPVWEPSHTLPAFKDAPRGPLPVTTDLAGRLLNIPSGFRETA